MGAWKKRAAWLLVPCGSLAMSAPEPAPKRRRCRRPLAPEERLFRTVLGVLRYDPGCAASAWMPHHVLLARVRRRCAWRARPSPAQLQVALDFDPSRIQTFAWRDCGWSRAQPARRLRHGPPGLELPADAAWQ